MTSPRHMPQFGIWSVPNCQLIIEYDLEVLEAVRREVTLGFENSNGGIEVAGLLLGDYNGERVRITAFEPILCEHAFGPMFIPSQDDTARLARQIHLLDSQAATSGEMVVGWYESHVRRGLALSAEDIKIYDRHFPKPWQVALLLRPAPAGSVHARFFLRETGEAVVQPAKPAAAAENATVRLDSARDVRERPLSTPAAPVPRADGSRVVKAAAQPAPLPAVLPLEEPHEVASTFTANARTRGIQSKAVWTVLGAMFVLAVASVFYLRFNFAVAPTHVPDTIPVAAGIRDGGLEIRWDPKTLGNVRQGRLEVRNGSIVQQFPLDRDMLLYGRFSCFPKSDVTNLRLHVERTDGAALEGSTTYVARSVSVPADVVAQAAPPPSLPPLPAPTQEAAAKPPVDDRKTAATPTPSTPTATHSTAAPKQAVEAPKQAPSSAPAATQPKQEEPPKPKPESPAAEPVQTAQVQRPTTAEIPTPTQATPVQPQPAAVTPPPRVQPQATSAAAPNASAPQFRLGGRWLLQSGAYSRSPAVPESLAVTVTETDGTVHGVLEARYKSRSRPGRVHFSFSGKLTNGVARFGWTNSEGKPSQIEFIHVPSSPDVVEVVWQNPETKQVFDEMLRRSN